MKNNLFLSIGLASTMMIALASCGQEIGATQQTVTNSNKPNATSPSKDGKTLRHGYRVSTGKLQAQGVTIGQSGAVEPTVIAEFARDTDMQKLVNELGLSGSPSDLVDWQNGHQEVINDSDTYFDDYDVTVVVPLKSNPKILIEAKFSFFGYGNANGYDVFSSASAVKVEQGSGIITRSFWNIAASTISTTVYANTQPNLPVSQINPSHLQVIGEDLSVPTSIRSARFLLRNLNLLSAQDIIVNPTNPSAYDVPPECNAPNPMYANGGIISQRIVVCPVVSSPTEDPEFVLLVPDCTVKALEVDSKRAAYQQAEILVAGGTISVIGGILNPATLFASVPATVAAGKNLDAAGINLKIAETNYKNCKLGNP